MDCLNDFIGLNNAGASGLSLTGLPGITLDNFKKIKYPSDSEDTALWNKIQERAIRKFATACMARLNECYKINDPVVVSCLVCEKKDLFATSLWYLVGAETMIERIYSDRLNRWTTIDKTEAQELLNYYTSQHEDELRFAIQGINPEDSDCIEGCIDCNGSVRWEESEL